MGFAAGVNAGANMMQPLVDRMRDRRQNQMRLEILEQQFGQRKELQDDAQAFSAGQGDLNRAMQDRRNKTIEDQYALRARQYEEDAPNRRLDQIRATLATVDQLKQSSERSLQANRAKLPPPIRTMLDVADGWAAERTQTEQAVRLAEAAGDPARIATAKTRAGILDNLGKQFQDDPYAVLGELTPTAKVTHKLPDGTTASYTMPLDELEGRIGPLRSGGAAPSAQDQAFQAQLAAPYMESLAALNNDRAKALRGAQDPGNQRVGIDWFGGQTWQERLDDINAREAQIRADAARQGITLPGGQPADAPQMAAPASPAMQPFRMPSASAAGAPITLQSSRVPQASTGNPELAQAKAWLAANPGDPRANKIRATIQAMENGGQ
jgi:hypothetical protein